MLRKRVFFLFKLAFKSIFEASLAPFAYAHYRVFACSHCSHFCRFAAKNTKTRGSFDFQKNFYCFPGTFSTFKSTPEASLDTFSTLKSAFVGFPARFHASKVLLRLSLRVFSVQKNFCAFPGAISTFKSAFVAFPAQFSAFKSTLSQCYALLTSQIKDLLTEFSYGKLARLFQTAKTRGLYSG